MNRQRLARGAAWALLGVILAATFLAYGHPNMLLAWETVMQMCGLR
jgi:hypothetical protein